MVAKDECNRRPEREAVVPAQAGLKKKRTRSTMFEMFSPRFTAQMRNYPARMVERQIRRGDQSAGLNPSA